MILIRVVVVVADALWLLMFVNDANRVIQLNSRFVFELHTVQSRI